ncbi:MAG: M13-type metalloendopeptidase [Hominilimicola sp.]
MLKRAISLVTAAAMSFSLFTFTVSADDGYATRGEVCEMLLNAADDYNSDVQKSDILKGYEDGELHEDWNVTRAEAVVMLARAFGDFPELKGYNKYVAIPKESFTDIPDWANDEMNRVFDAGLVAGKDEGIFAPYDNVTTEEMNLWIERVYALFGTNLKDNFYTTINHDTFEELEIGEGKTGAGKMSEMNDVMNNKLAGLVKKAAASDAKSDTPEGKVKVLYNNIMDKESQDKEGISPLKPYLDKLDKAANIDDIIDFELYRYKETGSRGLFGFEIMTDSMDSDSYMTCFATASAKLPKEAYSGEADYLKNAYMNYVKTVFMIAGDSEEDAEKNMQTVWNIETQLSEVSLNPKDYHDVSKIYNIYSLEELDEIYKTVDMQKVFDGYGYQNKEKINVVDVSLMEKIAELLTDENADSIKTYLRYNLIQSYSSCLGTAFSDAKQKLNEEAYGISGSEPDDIKAVSLVKEKLSMYLDMMYKEAYYSQETVDDVTKMIEDAIEVYKDKIKNIDWMGDTTKEKALKKLETMGYKVGSPTSWNDYLSDMELKSYAEGGSLFENIVEISKAEDKRMHSLEGTKVDKSEWAGPGFTVNAFYNPEANDITIPFGYLQEPMYSKDYSYEENLAGIGTVICHELSHAFDDGGAQFDENGNATDWWTAEDKAAFEGLCQNVVEFFDGKEGAPGIAENGQQTLGENIADLGGISCVEEIAAKTPDFDYKKMYEAYAKMWALLFTRERLEYLAMSNVHSLPAIRTNRILQSSDKFYEVYGISEGDGMWIAPEDRAKIW